MEIYTFLILEYLVLILIVSYFVRRLENKLKKIIDKFNNVSEEIAFNDIKKISEMIITNDYEKYFVVLDNEDIEENNELFNDVIEVYETSTINQNLAR